MRACEVLLSSLAPLLPHLNLLGCGVPRRAFMTKSSFALTAAALEISLLTCSPPLSAGAKDGAPKSASAVTLRAIAGTGTVSGKVDAPKEFKAAEVYIRHADKNIIYMVYTAAGRYQATDLLPGSYELTVRKNGFAADTKKLVMAAGDNATIDFSLREAPFKALVGVHPGYNGREKQSASYEQLYPAGPGRLLIEKTCMVCHGPDFIPSHHWSASQWNEAIDLMSDPNGLIKSRILPGTFSARDREDLVDYLVKYYGPDSESRHLEVPEMPLDEK